MRKRELGRHGGPVAAIGLGCMGMSEFYGETRDAESLATLRHALDAGVTFWDTADIYGVGKNETLLAEVLRGRRDEVFLATKFGIVREPDGSFVGVNGRPEYVASACDGSLARLGVDHVDLYYQHRVDPKVPIEETIGAMSRLVEAGKVRHLGLSEASAETVRRAAAVHPIEALQTEYSLWTRDVETEVLPACRELGISLVAYSPLGRGFLGGSIRNPGDLDENDWRRTNPRFEEENFRRNLDLLARLEAIAKKKGCTPAQLALAWLLHRGPDVIPIPGTRRRERLDENTAAAEIELSASDLERIDEAFPEGAASGTRYPERGMALVNGSSA